MQFAVLLNFGSTAFCQTTWVKKIPHQGQLAAVTFVKNDTLYSFGSNFKNPVKRPTEVYVSMSLLDGTYLFSDTIDFEKIINDSNAYFLILYPDQVIYNSAQNRFEMGQGSYDTFKGRYKVRNSILSYPEKQKVEGVYNYDTLENELFSLKYFNNKRYGANLLSQTNVKGEPIIIETYIPLYENDSFKKIYKQTHPYSSSANLHKRFITNVYEDIKSNAGLFASVTEFWNEFENIQDHIVKLDTFGNVLWDCRLNNNDSTNTSYTQLAQKPNGNLLVFWSDWEYGAFQPQNPGMLSQSSNWGCLVMSEIDYETGKVLWRSNLRDILISKMERLDKDPQRNFTSGLEDKSIHREFKYLTYTNDGIVLAGDFNTSHKAYDRVPFVKPYFRNKMFPFLLKIDFNGNVVWYREIDVYQDDSTCTGMEVKHIALMPDSGFLLSGAVSFKDSFSNSTPYAAMLKLDKNGCFESNCNQYDAVEKVVKENEGLLVYPNPAADEVTLTLKDEPKTAQIHIYNSQGVLVKTMVWQGAKTIKINTQNLLAGIYLIEVSNENQKFYAKLQVEK